MPKKASLLSGNGVSVSELLELIPSSLLDELAADLSVDKWVRKLKAEGLFKLVLYSLLDSERLSLRVMESNTCEPSFRALYPAFTAEKATWVGIRERLIKLNPDYCRRLYEAVYDQAQALYGEASLDTYHIKRYDSTMVATYAHLMEGMRVGNTKGGKTQVKLTTEFVDDFNIQMYFHKDQKHLSEEKALKEAILKGTHRKEDIIVFDKGLKSRESFAEFAQAGVQFVGRVHANARYELLRVHTEKGASSQALEFIEDSVVYLYKDGTDIVETELRLIRYKCLKNGQTISFITNIWHLPGLVIAQFYRRRWDIEVLFRFMKQEMNLTHFVCNDSNAIQVMLYFTMIASMLVLIYKKRNGITSYKMAKIQFFKELTYSIFIDILDIPEAVEAFKLNFKRLVKRE